MPNYVFKPTAEQALRSIQSAARRRLNTALGLHVKHKGTAMIKILVALASTLFLVACAPATYQGLKENNAGSETFRSQMSASDTFITIKAKATACYTGKISAGGPGATAYMTVNGEANELGEGVITVVLDGMLGKDMHMAVEVTSIDESSSRVTTTYATRFWKKGPALVKRWAETESNDCKPE